MNVSEKATARSCPMCGHHDGFDHADTRGDEWHLKVCAQCRFVYLQNPPQYEALIEDFAWEKTFSTERRRRFTEEPLLSRFSQLSKFVRHRIFKRDKTGSLLPRFVQPGPVLDVGCGAGHSVNKKFGEKYEPWGIEISKSLATKANEIFSRRGGSCIHDNAKSGMSGLPGEFFTGMTMLSFLEHEANPREVCKAAYRCLRSGGHLIVKVPNHGSWNRYLRGKKWCGYRFPDHVNYFTPSSLSKLMTDAGFSVVKFQWIDRLPISDNMWIVVQKP